MGIHQIQIRYDESEDRLLLRLSTTDNSEFRFWLTRRFTKRLWGMLVQMLEWDHAVKQQINPEMRRTVLDIRQEGYSRQMNYSKSFDEPAPEAPRKLPLGEAPVLLAKARGKQGDKNLQLLSLHPAQGQGIDINLDNRLLHIFVRLLREQVAKTDWDVKLDLNERAGEVPPAAEASSPRLN